MDFGISALNNLNFNDSASSFDAADVLIRSTKVILEQTKENDQPQPHINIYVRRLSDSADVSGLTETSKQGFVEQSVPPVLPANMTSPLSAGSEEQGYMASKQALGVARNSHFPRAGKDALKSTHIQTRESEQKGQDVLISRYSADGRGAVVAALKQRSHSAPVRREVKVQLLDAGSSPSVGLQSTEVQQPHPAFPAGDGGAATAVAAITAAAIAATAPIIQAQNEMEARVAQVASELRRLQDAESQASRAAGRGADGAPDRAAQLEEQLTTLTQQRLQHLEKIQGQQLELQNRLLGSALDAVAARSGPASLATSSAGHGRADPESAQRPGFRTLVAGNSTAAASADYTAVQVHSRRTQTGWVQSPLETPAPRKIIPKPTNWIPTAQNSQQSNRTHKATKENDGDGRPLEWIPISQRSPTRSPAHSAGARGVAVATVNEGKPKHFREDPPKASISLAGKGHPVSTSIKSDGPRGGLRDGAPSTQGTVRQASAVLRDLSRLEEERRDVFRPSEQGNVVPVSWDNMLQKPPPPTSMFEDAGCVLRQVRQGRKVLEENLQAILRAKDGEALHTQLEALATNRDATEELRVKKTVDAWISTLSKEIEEELAQVAADTAPAERRTPGVQGNRGGARAGRAGPEARRRPRESVTGRPASGQHPSVRSGVEQRTQTPVLRSDDGEADLTKVYGRALYEGQRRTLKKGPYLRFSSPPPKPRVQRPKLIESVKGVKMKSSKTQTSASAVLLPPTFSQPQYLFSPSSPCRQEQLVPGSSLQGFLIPMAIPLGEPRLDGQMPLPSRVIISDKPAIVTTSFLPAPAGSASKVAPPIRKPNTVLLEVCSEPGRPAPQLQIQVQPSVNIESVRAPSPAQSPPLLPSPAIQAGAGARASQDHEDQDGGFPGTSFLAVTDVSQESEAEAEAPGSCIELNGLPSPPAALYHGPVFPLQPAPPLPIPVQGPRTAQHTDTLENQLVDWVEQQLMARVISGMFPPPDPADQSEPAESVTSDIAEPLDADIPLDSELIRQCVNEVLAEVITATLSQRQSPPTAPQDTCAQLNEHSEHTETAVPTPVPTPEPSAKDSLPALKNALTPVSTPALSEQPSPAQSPRDSQPVPAQEPALPDPAKPPVDTPTSSPDPSPRRLATPSPPPELPNLRNLPWGEAELPLKEEDPHSEEEELRPPPIVLSVAHEEEVDTVIPPSFPVPPKPQRLPSVVVEEPPPAPSESLSVEESSSSSSPTRTETETAARHISEGELLLSSGQMAVIRALEEEGFTLPHPMTSFNSSLHGVQDMDYDPPSEGQVIRRPLVPAHHDPLLSLLARMEQDPPSQSQLPQGCWDEESSGEVSEGQRPLLTTAQERVVIGHSLLPQEPPVQASWDQSPHATLNSPGQLHTQITGCGGTPAEDGGLSVNVRPTEEHVQSPDALHLFTTPPLPQPGDQQAAESPRPPRAPALILVKQRQAQLEPGAEGSLEACGGGQLISVTLPTVHQDDQSPSNQSSSVSTLEGDSHSASDVF